MDGKKIYCGNEFLPIFTPKTKFINFYSVLLHDFVTLKCRVCIPEKNSEINNNNKGKREKEKEKEKARDESRNQQVTFFFFFF